MRLIYVGAHTAVTMPAVPGVEINRHGPAVDIPDDIAEGLIARGDFVEFEPEPPAPPVQKTKTKSKAEE